MTRATLQTLIAALLATLLAACGDNASETKEEVSATQELPIQPQLDALKNAQQAETVLQQNVDDKRSQIDGQN